MCAARAEGSEESRSQAGQAADGPAGTDSASTAEEIRQEMEHLRLKLKDDVQDVVEQTKKLSDWRYLVRSQPWIFFGAAAAVGYLLVPRRLNVMRPDAKTLVRMAKQNRLLVKPEAEVSRPAGVVGPVVSLFAGVLMRNAATLAGQKLSQLFAGAGGDGKRESPPTEDVMHTRSAKPR